MISLQIHISQQLASILSHRSKQVLIIKLSINKNISFQQKINNGSKMMRNAQFRLRLRQKVTVVQVILNTTGLSNSVIIVRLLLQLPQ